MGINIRLDDITVLHVDAIVNAANNSLLGGGGVDGRIHEKAGIGLYNECRTLGGCETGHAKITKGYNLPAQYVIHTVGPIYNQQKDKECAKLLSMCYENSLNLAQKNDLHTIAFPSIATGIYGYPKGKAARIALDTVTKWLKKNKKYDMNVIFCCYDAFTFNLYKKLEQEYI